MPELDELNEQPIDGAAAAAEAHSAEEPAEAMAEVAPEEAAVVEQDEPVVDPHANMSWYIIHTYSGFERKVEESLRTRAEAFGFDNQLGQILIPKEKVVEMKNGKKVESERLLYPGYVMIQMQMDDRLWHEVKNTPRVTGFVGGGNTPVPLTADEVNKVLFRQTKTGDAPRPKVTYEKNETVRIIDGPFNNFTGKVDRSTANAIRCA